MTPFGLRRRLILLLGGFVPEEEDGEVEADDTDGDVGPTRVFVIPAGGPVGPWTTSGEHGRIPAELAIGASGTMRNGPTGESWAMKVVDCAGQSDPATDAEVQVLLAGNWEPFGVTKFTTFTGAEGIRMYFKRQRTSRPAVGLAAGPPPGQA